MKLLIVEDHIANREALAELLTYTGYEVRTAATGEQGLVSVRQDRPDLILLDMIMPGMDGQQFLNELKIRAIKIPVLITTSLSPVEFPKTPEGALGVLHKPFEVQSLISTISSLHLDNGKVNS